MDLTIGARIRRAREEASLTQDALARKADVNLRSLLRYEKDHTKPSADALQRICVALDVTSDSLLGLPSHPSTVQAPAAAGECPR